SSCSPPTATSTTDTVIAVYTSGGGCGGPFTQIACNDDFGPSCTGSTRASLAVALTAGTQYYIVVWKFNTTPPTTCASVQLRISLPAPLPPPPPNESCAGAIALMSGMPVRGTTAGAVDGYELNAAACYNNPPTPAPLGQ